MVKISIKVELTVYLFSQMVFFKWESAFEGNTIFNQEKDTRNPLNHRPHKNEQNVPVVAASTSGRLRHQNTILSTHSLWV